MPPLAPAGSPPLPLRRVCVYCGASTHVDAKYLAVARDVGRTLAERGVTIVFGGGRVGLMGAVADAALAAGGTVYGVIPERLRTKEVAHEGVSELFVVEGMHARKTMMAALSDAFVALPGGLGTLEELFEVATWAQLGYHGKPIGVLDAFGYYDGLVTLLARAANDGFLRSVDAELIHFAPDIGGLLTRLEASWPARRPRVVDET